MPPSANPPTLRPIRPAGLIIVIAILLLFSALGITFLCLAFEHGLPSGMRVSLLLGAIAGLAAPTYILTVTIRRFRRTGELMPSIDERLNNRRRFAERQRSPRYQLAMNLFFRATSLCWLAMALTFVWALIAHPANRFHDLLWTAIGAFNAFNFWPRDKRLTTPPHPEPSA